MALVERYEIAAFFAQADDTLLLAAIGEAIEAAVTVGGLEGVSPAARVLARANRAEYLVGNGGFAYFFEPKDHEAEATLAALQAIGADEAVAALRGALSRFPGGRPHDDWQQRMNFLAAMSDKARKQLDAGAHTLSDLSLLQARFARAHLKELAKLPPVSGHIPPQPLPVATAPSRSVARWLCSHGLGVEFEPLSPWTSRWSVRNGTTWKPEWRVLAGIHFVEPRRDPVGVAKALAGLRAAAGVVRAVIDSEVSAAHDVPLLSLLARLPKLRELELWVETLSPELVQTLQEVRRLRHLRIVAQGVTHDVAKQLVAGRRPRHAELTCPKAAPSVRASLAEAGWLVGP
ncbi:MAG: DUF4375 domain-containing protein [Planctomycetes bacterium]|nr:DUF4375 domain-containing protein [Planctomycetota bacterium]